MPPLARAERSEQIAEMSRLAHELLTGTEFEHALDRAWEENEKNVGADTSADSWEAERLLRKREMELLRDRRDKTAKLPSEFVQRLSQKTNLAQGVWESAKKNRDFAEFAPVLEELVDLAREQADYYGYTTEAYDALLDDYEKGATGAGLAEIFRDLKKDLIPLVDRAQSAPNPFGRGVAVECQEEFCKTLPPALGLPDSQSRLDRSSHPFSTSLGGKDKRITTRYNPHDPLSAVFGVMHEVGHSLYEAGLSEIPGAPHPLAEYLSLGIHESQSRLWENQVGRSRAFWEYYYPKALSAWKLTEKNLPLDSLLAYTHRVEKTKIRVEADPVTYNLHIILRFEIERNLVAGRISVRDLPEVWNAQMSESLGLTIDNPAEGVLQDIHWSMAAFGYFPTYTLGNLYSAMFYRAFLKSNPGFPETLAKTGDTSSLLVWLRKNIHHKGKILETEELIRQATGKSPSAEDLVAEMTALCV